MNRYIKQLLILSAVLLLCAFLALAAFAVPAKPGTHAGSDRSCRSHPGQLVTLDSLQPTAVSGHGAKAPVQPLAETSIPLVVVVLGYNNFPYADDYDWSNTIFEGEKSLSAYYSDMSFGKFTFVPAEETSAFEIDGNTNAADAVNDGVVHLKMDLDHEDWSLDYGSNFLLEQRMSRSLDLMLLQAVQQADPYIDFAAYDNNGDGEITNNELALAFVVAGYEASEDLYGYKEGKEYYLWAHAWTLAEAVEEVGGNAQIPTPDGVAVSPYIAIAEQLSHDGGQAPISVLAHELGHYLGLPDLYDTESGTGAWRSYDVSGLSVMASGSWGEDENGNYCPYSMDVWSRTVLGWCTPTEVDQSGDYAVNAQSYDTENEIFSAVKIPTSRADEYYLLENRQNTKWDVNLVDHLLGCPNPNGILLWHVDMAQYLLYEESNKVNNSDHHPAVMPLYPEGSAGAYTFLGASSKVEYRRPFFDKTRWETAFANLGDVLDLPLYGAGADADQRASRIASGIQVRFLDDSAAEMHVHVEQPVHVHHTVFVDRDLTDCKAGGRIAHWLCTGCNLLFADEAAQSELTEEQVTIAPAEHTWNRGEVFVEPNYDDEGLKCYTCMVCGKVRYESLPTLQRPQQEPQKEPDQKNLCPYCHQEHKGFFGFFVKIFHLFLNLFHK